MREITFLKQNAQKWEALEKQSVDEKNIDPAQLTQWFIEITDDLSYATTNYPNTKTSQYVNGLASHIHHLVYKNKRETGNRFITFYTRELPGFFARYHKELLYAFLLTAVSTLIGVVSQVYDDNFVRMVLGDAYVDSTIQRIKQGNALGIYGEENQFLMFVWITKNNIGVSFMAFVMGIFTAFGTSLLILHNGIMLGCFFTLFYQHNVLREALKVVWIHGALEISAIVIAGCAGFVLGNSFIFPGTYPRLDALKRAGKDGVKIIVGLIPVFICAGFLESFVTRYTRMPVGLSAFIIGISFAFIIGYFIILPLYLKRRTNTHS